MPQHFEPPGRNGDQQPAGSLRVESQIHRRLIHARRNVKRIADILAVPLDRAGNDPLAQSVQRAVERGQRVRENLRAQSPQHPPQMREEAEARHIGAGRRPGFLHGLGRRLIKRRHGSFGGGDALGMHPANLIAKRQHAGAKRLGQDQRVAGFWLFQRGSDGGIDQTRDGEAQFDLIILDAVPAHERDTGLLENLHCAVKHLKNNLARQFFGGKRQHAQRRARLAAHGVDVGETIRRADFAEETRVIDARREHIHGLHQAKIVRDAINRRVIGGGEAGEDRRVVHRREPAQQRIQVGWRDLRGAAGVARQLCQLDP